MHFLECQPGQPMAAYLRDAQKGFFGVQRIAQILLRAEVAARRNQIQAFLRIPVEGSGCDWKTLEELSGFDHQDRSQLTLETLNALNAAVAVAPNRARKLEQGGELATSSTPVKHSKWRNKDFPRPTELLPFRLQFLRTAIQLGNRFVSAGEVG